MSTSPPSLSPIRSLKSSTRVRQTALTLSASSSSSSLNPPRSPRSPQAESISHEMERLQREKHVESLRSSFNSSSEPPSPASASTPRSRSRTNDLIATTPTKHNTTTTSATEESPATSLASQLANMSLDRDRSPEGSNTKSSGRRGLFGLGGSGKGKGKERNGVGGDGEEDAFGGGGGMGVGIGIQGVGMDVEEILESPTNSKKGKTGARKVGSNDELELLVVSSGITSLNMSIEECNTLVFEIQELRHTTAIKASSPDPTSSTPSGPTSSTPIRSASSSSLSSSSITHSLSSDSDQHSTRNPPSALSEVDAALMRLDAKLEVVTNEFKEVEQQVVRLFGDEGEDVELGDGEAGFLMRKWKTTKREWETTQKDADLLSEELKEDKWLVVFRTVSQQAEDMMKSLEKVLTQSTQFVYDLNRRRAKNDARNPPDSSSASSNPYFGDPSTIQPLLSSFVALHRSLHAKVKYYSPACDRVLKILGKGIADRSTKNGEVLRRFSEMKSRWRNLLERITRIETEMAGVEEMLREAARPVADDNGAIESLSSSTNDSNMSPFRRFANKVSARASPSTSATGSPAARPSPSSRPPPSTSSSFAPRGPPRSLSSADIYSHTLATTSANASASPPRPPKSARRMVSGTSSVGGTPPRTPMAHTLGHRRSASNLEVPSYSRPPPRRAASPAFSSTSEFSSSKPRWNISTKRAEDQQETLRSSLSSRPPISGGGTPSRSVSGVSGRNSAMGLRSSSRMSNSLSRSFHEGGSNHHHQRAVSPTFSEASSQYIRDRPSTGSTPSRIPAPRRTSVIGAGGAFSSLEDHEPSSLLQRAMSPTPSATSTNYRSSHLNSSRRASRTLLSPTTTSGGKLSPPRASSPTPSNTSGISSYSSYNHRGGQTPEPNLAAHARRLSHIRPSGSRNAPPVPTIPTSLRDGNATPRPSYAPGGGGGTNGSRRPSTALSSRTEGAGGGTSSSHPPPHGNNNFHGGPYLPNKLDPLDILVAQTINSLPLLLQVERFDPPLTRAQVAQQEVLQARYFLQLPDGGEGEGEGKEKGKPVVVKLVDKVGPRAVKGEKKVLVRVGGGWMDLGAYGMGLLANGV